MLFDDFRFDRRAFIRRDCGIWLAYQRCVFGNRFIQRLLPLLIAIATMAAAAAFTTVIVFFIVAAGFFLEQGLPVSDGDLIIIRMDFREGEKTVPVAAVIDEGGLQRRLDPRDLGEINVAAKRFAAGG